MKKIFLLFFFFLMFLFCHAQHRDDSIQYYSMLNFILDNQSLIKSHVEFEREEKYDVKKLYINQNEMGKIFCIPWELNNRLHKYYENLQYNELHLAIRKDFVKYTFEEPNINEYFFKRMNSYLDSILRKGENADTSIGYWSILFSDSFYDYKSVVIFCHNERRHDYFAETFEIVFLFDEQNRITAVNTCLLIP
jgi:hypothetical protein